MCNFLYIRNEYILILSIVHYSRKWVESICFVIITSESACFLLGLEHCQIHNYFRHEGNLGMNTDFAEQ